MLRIKPFLSFTLVLTIVMIGTAGIVNAESPGGVPRIPLGPTECITEPGGYFKISAVPVGGVWPVVLDPCTVPSSGACTKYEYMVESLRGKKPDHTVIVVSADQYLLQTNPSSYIPDNLGDGDSKTKIAKFMYHEYPVRFNERDSTLNFELFIEEASTPEPTTVFVSSGKIKEACSIAGPGDPGDPFVVQNTVNQITSLSTPAGDPIFVELKFVNKKLVKVTPQCTVGEDCFTGILENIDGHPVQTLEAPLTFGFGTTTCWPLSPPFCICTELPCP